MNLDFDLKYRLKNDPLFNLYFLFVRRRGEYEVKNKRLSP
jgi:hypothetical protein